MVNFVLPIRGVQMVFCIILIAISGYMVGQVEDDVNVGDSRFNYTLFTSLWTFVILLPLFAFQFIMKDSGIAPIVSIVLDGLTWLFWIAAFACIAAIIGDGHGHSGLFGAFIAFGVLEWLLFCVTFGLAIMGLLRGGRGKV